MEVNNACSDYPKSNGMIINKKLVKGFVARRDTSQTHSILSELAWSA